MQVLLFVGRWRLGLMFAIGASVRVRGAAGDRSPGSIGAFATNADGVWLISANHVLAANGAFLPTADPSHGVYLGEQRVSRTIVFRTLHRAGNRADAAACLLAAPGGFRPVWLPGWKPSPQPFTPPVRARVKIFAAGQERFGVVSHRGAFRVSMRDAGFPGPLGEVEFLDSILVRTADPMFRRPGNSGSLVVTQTGCRPVGLITGTSMEHGSDYVVVSLLAHVLDALGLPGQILV